jgi:hypothetical protein
MMLNSFNDMDGYEEHFSLGDFDKIVAKFKLEPDFMLTVEDEKIMINEIWSHPKNKSVSANRIYEFDIFFLELIPDEIKKRVLEEVLDKADLPKNIPLLADKGYQSEKNAEVLKRRKLKNRILKKAKKDQPLTHREKTFNKLIGKVRYKVLRFEDVT